MTPLADSNAASNPEEAVAPKWLTSQGNEKTQKIKRSVKIKSSVKILAKKKERRELFQKGLLAGLKALNAEVRKCIFSGAPALVWC